MPCSWCEADTGGSVVQDDVGDQAGGHGDQYVVTAYLHPMVTAGWCGEAMLMVVHHHVLAIAVFTRNVATAPEFGASRVVVIMLDGGGWSVAMAEIPAVIAAIGAVVASIFPAVSAMVLAIVTAVRAVVLAIITTVFADFVSASPAVIDMLDGGRFSANHALHRALCEGCAADAEREGCDSNGNKVSGFHEVTPWVGEPSSCAPHVSRT
jgi:hypothetical protein